MCCLFGDKSNALTQKCASLPTGDRITVRLSLDCNLNKGIDTTKEKEVLVRRSLYSQRNRDQEAITRVSSQPCLGTKMLVQEQGRWKHHSLKPPSSPPLPTSLALWITKQPAENHTVPYVDTPTGRECTYQRTRRSSLLQIPASPYNLMNWHLI